MTATHILKLPLQLKKDLKRTQTKRKDLTREVLKAVKAKTGTSVRLRCQPEVDKVLWSQFWKMRKKAMVRKKLVDLKPKGKVEGIDQLPERVI
jgi:hypothetical protein